MDDFVNRLLRFLILSTALFANVHATAQPVANPDYSLLTLDGKNRFTEHFAVIPAATAGSYVGFFFLEDENLLYRADCTPTGCVLGSAFSTAVSTAGRGRHASAAMRPTIAKSPLVAGYDANNGDLVVFDCTWNSPACASGAAERVLDNTGDVGRYSSVAINGTTDQALISYYDASNADLKLYVCSNVSCSAGTRIVVDSSGDRGRHSASVFAGGALWIAYDDTDNGSIRLARAPAPFDTFTFFDVGNGSDPAIAARNDGGVDLVWTGASGELMHRRCTDATCSTPVTQQLAAGGLGHAPSLHRLANGNLFATHRNAATGDLLGTICVDDGCSATRHAVTLENGPGMGAHSVALGQANASPFAIHLDSTDSSIRVAACDDAICNSITRNLASNGVSVGPPEVITRPDGRPIVAWYRLSGLIRLALCENANCGRYTVRTIGNSGSGERVQPALAVRPDGRPLVYYSTGGGTGLWNCSNTECSSGTPSLVSSPGSLNHTGDVAEIGMRSDGRAVLMFYNKIENDLYLHLCNDAGCSSGVQRRITDETVALTHPALAIDAQDRPLVAYTTGNGTHKFVRCDDASCNSVTSGAYTGPTILGQALAVRSDDRPATVSSNGTALEFGLCDNAPCTSAASFPLPATAAPNRLLLAPGDRPLFDFQPIGSAGYLACDDATCTSWSTTATISDARATASFDTAPAPGLDARPVIAVRTMPDMDTVLLIGKGETVFADSFD